MFGPINFYIVRNTSFTIVFVFMVLNLLNACMGASPEDGKENSWGSKGCEWDSSRFIVGVEGVGRMVGPVIEKIIGCVKSWGEHNVINVGSK